MSEKKKTSKLDKTVKTTKRGMKAADTLPEYVKPWPEFRKRFQQGAICKIWVRRQNLTTGFYLLEKEVILLEEAPNVFYYEDEDGLRNGCPWWAVYNFEFSAAGDGGEDQLD